MSAVLLARKLRELSGFILVAVAVLLWEWVARSGLVRSDSFPSFSAVAVAFADGMRTGELPLVLSLTLARMFAGYVIGSAIGVAVGVAMGASRAIRMTIEPVIELLRPVPTIAIIPPLIFFLGMGTPLTVFVVAVAAFFPVLISTLAGVTAVEPMYRQVASTFRVPAYLTLRSVVVPAALPYVFAGLRTSFGIALVVAIVTEMVAGASGIGHYLVLMQYALRPADMYAATILLGITGYLLNWAFVAWEARVIHWARARR